MTGVQTCALPISLSRFTAALGPVTYDLWSITGDLSPFTAAKSRVSSADPSVTRGLWLVTIEEFDDTPDISRDRPEVPSDTDDQTLDAVKVPRDAERRPRVTYDLRRDRPDGPLDTADQTSDRQRGPLDTRDQTLDNPDGPLDTADRKSTRLNSSHIPLSRMPSSA